MRYAMVVVVEAYDEDEAFDETARSLGDAGQSASDPKPVPEADEYYTRAWDAPTVGQFANFTLEVA